MLKWNLRWVTGKTEPMEKFRKLNRWNICVSSFPSVNINGISSSAIMKKLKKIFKLLTPTKCQQKWNISISHYKKKLKNGCHFFNIDHTEKLLIPPPKVWVSSFLLIRKLEMQIFFFLNFPLAHFSSSPILGSISTFMHGYT